MEISSARNRRVVAFGALRAIWSQRNACIFQGSWCYVENIITGALSMCLEWRVALDTTQIFLYTAAMHTCAYMNKLMNSSASDSHHIFSRKEKNTLAI